MGKIRLTISNVDKGTEWTNRSENHAITLKNNVATSQKVTYTLNYNSLLDSYSNNMWAHTHRNICTPTFRELHSEQLTDGNRDGWVSAPWCPYKGMPLGCSRVWGWALTPTAPCTVSQHVQSERLQMYLFTPVKLQRRTQSRDRACQGLPGNRVGQAWLGWSIRSRQASWQPPAVQWWLAGEYTCQNSSGDTFKMDVFYCIQITPQNFLILFFLKKQPLNKNYLESKNSANDSTPSKETMQARRQHNDIFQMLKDSNCQLKIPTIQRKSPPE